MALLIEFVVDVYTALNTPTRPTRAGITAALQYQAKIQKKLGR